MKKLTLFAAALALCLGLSTPRLQACGDIKEGKSCAMHAGMLGCTADPAQFKDEFKLSDAQVAKIQDAGKAYEDALKSILTADQQAKLKDKAASCKRDGKKMKMGAHCKMMDQMDGVSGSAK